MSRNNVRGPTSALTEFLRESGITPTTIARRRATADAANATAPVAGPSNAEQDADSDDEDDGEDAERPSPKKKGKGKRKVNNTPCHTFLLLTVIHRRQDMAQTI